jgi:hypothetical protein
MALLEIFLLAVGSMFWPLLLIVVVLALNTTHPVRILAWFYVGGMITTVSVASAIVFTLQGSSLMSGKDMPSAPWVDVVIGALALGAAFVLNRLRSPGRRPVPPPGPKKTSRSSALVERFVERGGPLAFAGGIVATIFPGPLPLIAMANIAELGYSDAATLLVIVLFNMIMFTFVEVPIVSFAIAPEWTKLKTAQFNTWLAQNLLRLGVWALTVFGGAELVKGLVSLLS